MGGRGRYTGTGRARTAGAKCPSAGCARCPNTGSADEKAPADSGPAKCAGRDPAPAKSPSKGPGRAKCTGTGPARTRPPSTGTACAKWPATVAPAKLRFAQLETLWPSVISFPAGFPSKGSPDERKRHPGFSADPPHIAALMRATYYSLQWRHAPLKTKQRRSLAGAPFSLQQGVTHPAPAPV